VLAALKVEEAEAPESRRDAKRDPERDADLVADDDMSPRGSLASAKLWKRCTRAAFPGHFAAEDALASQLPLRVAEHPGGDQSQHHPRYRCCEATVVATVVATSVAGAIQFRKYGA